MDVDRKDDAVFYTSDNDNSGTPRKSKKEHISTNSAKNSKNSEKEIELSLKKGILRKAVALTNLGGENMKRLNDVLDELTDKILSKSTIAKKISQWII